MTGRNSSMSNADYDSDRIEGVEGVRVTLLNCKDFIWTEVNIVHLD